MEDRSTVHKQFVARFHSGSGDSPKRLDSAELDNIEAALDTKLPTAYREFVTHFGLVHTHRILKGIADRGLGHPDVQDFLTAEEVIENSKGYWSAGMPDDIIGFASDCMGNMIGFRRSHERHNDAPVVFFDHDFVRVLEMASSFDNFLDWYLKHLNDS